MKIKALLAASLLMLSVRSVSAYAAPSGFGRQPSANEETTTEYSGASSDGLIYLSEEDTRNVREGKTILAQKDGIWQLISDFQSVNMNGQTAGLLKNEYNTWNICSSNDPNVNDCILITSDMTANVYDEKLAQISELGMVYDNNSLELAYIGYNDTSYMTLSFDSPLPYSEGVIPISNSQVCVSKIRDLVNGNIPFIILEKNADDSRISFSCTDNISSSNYLTVSQEQISDEGFVFISDDAVLDKVYPLKSLIADDPADSFTINCTGEQPFLTQQQSTTPSSTSSSAVSTASTATVSSRTSATTASKATSEVTKTETSTLTQESSDTSETVTETVQTTTATSAQNKSSDHPNHIIISIVMEAFTVLLLTLAFYLGFSSFVKKNK